MDMVGSLPDGCTRLGRRAPEAESLTKGSEEVNRTVGNGKARKKLTRRARRTLSREKKSENGPPPFLCRGKRGYI